MIVRCDQDCKYQKDGYCTIEPPSAIAHYEPNGCVRCIQMLSRNDYEAGDTVATPAKQQTPPSQF
jgi:hypothetical protein